MANKVGLQPPFGIWEGGGADGALARFGGLLLSTRGRPKTLGIVLDCDSDDTGNSHGPMRRWDQIQHRLRDMPYVMPPIPALKGTIIEGAEEYPRIGVWLMPDNKEEGMLEDFLLQLVPASALSFAREVTRDAKARGFGSYKGVHESKAIVHTYLAWQDEPGSPLGIAVKSGTFDLENQKASDFIDWLRDLFQAPPVRQAAFDAVNMRDASRHDDI